MTHSVTDTPGDRRRRILLVDDDDLIVTLLTHILQHAGYDTVAASSAEAALELVAAPDAEPDLALLDVHMPGMSGLDAANYFQKNTTIPFMFLSSSVDSEVVRLAAEYGAVGYMVKPVDANNILPAVQAALARADDIKRYKRTEINLNQALNAGRETSMAVGLLMERHKTDRDTAFEVLRDFARSHRRKINDVAQELLNAAETLNRFEASVRGRRG